ncbi:ribosomal RNA methyltransferase FtsJ domain-containing protein [Flammula alnicola]|nr:ribosomal RNA methyltransferase FtsJ domain-containing protein [Flammula alnicola]
MAFRQTLVSLSQKAQSKSSAWAARQFRDPYVKKRLSDPAAYRARSAFKLMEINDKWNKFLDYPDVNAVVDLADKLGWNSVSSDVLSPSTNRPDAKGLNAENEGDASIDSVDSDSPLADLKPRRKNPIRGKPKPEPLVHFDPLNIDDVGPNEEQGRGTIIAVDLLSIAPIPGVQTIKADFMLDSTAQRIKELLTGPTNPFGKADVILSDMAANVSGNGTHDTQSSLEICEAAFDFARHHLRTAKSIGRWRGGVLIIKFFAHPSLQRFRAEKLKPNFNNVHFIKPDASRSASREGYFVCLGFNPK